ncbi:hypothetical protein QQP08_015582 [Theobroma cacao]|nr:hypothetical protein QQP08_015582 [Theobroma cacao]
MATRQISLAIFFLLFLSLLLLLPGSNGAVYRIHDLSLRSKQKDKMINFSKVSFNLLTKGVPIPPSGPSRRHNDAPDGDGSAVSTKDGLRV